MNGYGSREFSVKQLVIGAVGKFRFVRGIFAENIRAKRIHLQCEWSQFVIGHSTVKLVADNLEQHIEFGKVQSFIQHFIGKFRCFGMCMSCQKCIGVCLCGKVGTLPDKRFVVCQLGKTFVQERLQCEREIGQVFTLVFRSGGCLGYFSA